MNCDLMRPNLKPSRFRDYFEIPLISDNFLFSFVSILLYDFETRFSLAHHSVLISWPSQTFHLMLDIFWRETPAPVLVIGR